MAEEEREESKEELQGFESRSLDYSEQEEFIYTPSPKKKKKKIKNLVRGIPTFVVVFILFLLPFTFTMLRRFYPFHVSQNLVNNVVQFSDTIVDKIAYTLGFYSDKGEMPETYYEALEKEGIGVGKNTSGGFVHTNRVDSGEKLDLMFGGRIYTGQEAIISGLQKDGDFYWAFRNASGGDSLFFYDRSGEDTFTDMGINRDPYHNFNNKIKEITEDDSYDKTKKTAEQIAFEELFADAVNYDPSLFSAQTGAASSDEEGADCDEDDDPIWCLGDSSGSSESESDESEDDSDDGDESDADDYEAAIASAEDYIKKAAKQSETVQEAAALINAAISANEPYQASRASSAVVIAAEQAKSGNNGPINELANFLTAPETKTVLNADLKEEEVDDSVSSAKNLIAVVGKTEFSVEDAAEFSRDRVSTSQSVERESLDTTVSIFSGFKKFLSWIISLFTGGGVSDAEIGELQEAYKEDVARALFLNPSESMHGKTLGEKITEGGAFLNANLSKNAGASNASSEEKIAAYDSYTKTLADRRVIAERSVKSPFDISSSNTFLGSIVNSAYLIETDSNSMFGKFAKAFSLASSSFSKITLGVYADSEESNTTFLSKKGACPTLEAIGAKGDIYCNQIATYDVKSVINGKSFLETTIDDYATVFKDSIFEGDIEYDGNEIKAIKDNSKLAEYVILGSGRESTPGVKDANVCQAKKEGFSIGHFIRYIFNNANEAKCDADPSSEEGKVATGLAFADVEDNKTEWDERYVKYQGYFLTTYALELTGYYDAKGTANPIVALKENYYEKNPKDNSFAGVLARRTGWSKDEVIAGLEAINYLAYLNSYDPSSRLSFIEEPTSTFVDFEENVVPTDTRLADKNKIIFDEKRNRVVLI